MFDQVLDWLVAVLVLVGGALSLAAGIGLIRFPDVLTRLHSVTKPQVLGLFLVIIAIAIVARSWLVLLAVLPVFIFQALTAPVAAHMVARAAYRVSSREEKEKLFKDELAGPVSKADEEGETKSLE